MPAFAGLLDHIESHLGVVEGSDSSDTREFVLLFCRKKGNISVVSNGLRFQPVGALVPQEIVCTLHESQRSAAELLTLLAASLIVAQQEGLSIGRFIVASTVLVPGSSVCGVVAAAHPAAGEGFGTLSGDDGGVELQMITLLPTTADEILYAETHGPEALQALWRLDNTDLLDVYRDSVL